MQAVSIITNYQDRTTRKVFCLSLEISLAHANPESVCHKFVFAGPDQLWKINIHDAYDLSDVTVSMYLYWKQTKGYFIPLGYDGTMLEISMTFN